MGRGKFTGILFGTGLYKRLLSDQLLSQIQSFYKLVTWWAKQERIPVVK